MSSCLERGKKAKPAPEALEAASAAQSAPAIAAQVFRECEPSGVADSRKAIHLRLPAEPLHLNPMLAADTIAVAVTLGDVYEGLLLLNRPGEAVVPGLATEVTHRDKNRVWTFQLRDGVRFHSGAKLTPQDVVHSVALLKNAPSPLRADFDDLVSLEVEGERTLVFTFRESRAARGEAFAALPILSSKDFAGVDASKLARAPASLAANGTGPLRLEKWREQEIHLRRFDDYWGTPARSKDIWYHVIPDQELALAKLRAGKLHALLNLPIAFAHKAYRNDRDLVLVRQSLPAYTAAVFNTERPRMTLGFRQALSKSFDRKSIIRELFLSQVQAALGPFVAGSERAKPSVSEPEFSLRFLRNELSKSPPNASALQLLVPDSSYAMQRLADIWVSDLRALLPIKIIKLPFAELLTRVRAGDYDVVFLSFTTSDAVDLFSLFHSSEVGSGNLSRIRDGSLDTLLSKLRGCAEGTACLQLSRALHARIDELAPFAFLTTDVRLGLIRSELAGVGDTASTWGGRAMWLQQ